MQFIFLSTAKVLKNLHGKIIKVILNIFAVASRFPKFINPYYWHRACRTVQTFSVHVRSFITILLLEPQIFKETIYR